MLNDSRFAADNRVVVLSQKKRDDTRQLFPSLGADEGRTLGLLALHDELNTIRDIIATTIRFINTSRSETTWNDYIHGPILRLAVSSTPYVGAENITQAAIAKAFIPAARGTRDPGRQDDRLRPAPSARKAPRRPYGRLRGRLRRATDLRTVDARGAVL
ncbi:hypothetical protein DL766_007175 [Monosporascus sp. MC13-8B]|uniref:PD-(D/E)XK nuclease-like domain-containing protein n=1 Tax=Monosporascus cannonballus TaxID=155416 RepID=A0ABY0HG57_9PEZI|nr:hypothetical protein DL762_001937 [Monosporascus cannonballus]RYO91983.1 hypothetical protein DL763_004827 [Monosporascus cannonballus]RYP25049.1 hypothetical protein DL766_007175 [Monosporascus sp. MC13-8B]